MISLLLFQGSANNTASVDDAKGIEPFVIRWLRPVPRLFDRLVDYYGDGRGVLRMRTRRFGLFTMSLLMLDEVKWWA
jgi:hypothetical protein